MKARFPNFVESRRTNLLVCVTARLEVIIFCGW